MMIARPELGVALRPYAYSWPRSDSFGAAWKPSANPDFIERAMPESRADLANDSRWPALFPSPIAFVTTGRGDSAILEKVVGISIVNRFPYVMAVSVCREPLSERHYVRGEFSRRLEETGTAVVQFVEPGPVFSRLMDLIADISDQDGHRRLPESGYVTRAGVRADAPVLAPAYLAYEGRLVGPGRDFEGEAVNPQPYLDIGSHRVYLLEIEAIQLRNEIAEGRQQIRWRSLPVWLGHHLSPAMAATADNGRDAAMESRLASLAYRKTYTPDYRFPSSTTVAFEADYSRDGMAVKLLPPTPEQQVEVDNDRARWPCFFPSSVGMITTWGPGGRPTMMPCGSTTILSRQPLVVTPCISYSRINERYAPRATLEFIRAAGSFGCGVPCLDDRVLNALGYLGNVSDRQDPAKFANSGLTPIRLGDTPAAAELPIHFDCRVTGSVKLGTHVMFFGEVTRIFVRRDLTPSTPLQWCPIAEVVDLDG